MKLRNRATTQFRYVVKKSTNGKTVAELKREARQQGNLTIDYHYIIQRDGSIETGRDINEIAGNTLPDFDTAIYIQLDAKKNVTDAQRFALIGLTETIRAAYPGIECRKL